MPKPQASLRSYRVIISSSWLISSHEYLTGDSTVHQKEKVSFSTPLKSVFLLKKGGGGGVFLYFTCLHWAKDYEIDHLFNKYLLRANYGQETVIGAGNIAVTKTEKQSQSSWSMYSTIL